MPPRCLTSGQSLRYLSSHSVCACICVYLLSDLCNPCFNSVSSSSGAVTIHFLHFFPSLPLSLSLFLPEAIQAPWAIVHLFISLLLYALYMYFSDTHKRTHCCSAVSGRYQSVNQRARERENETEHISVIRERSCSSQVTPYVSLDWLYFFRSRTFASLRLYCTVTHSSHSQAHGLPTASMKHTLTHFPLLYFH